MSLENVTERRKPDSRSVMFLVYNATENKFVIEERIREDSSYRGFFMVPAGHVEKDEKPEEALIRELGEEHNIVPLEYYHLDTFESVSLNGNFFLVDAYLVKSYEGEIHNNETNKCVLHLMDFDEANQKLVLGQDRHILSMVQRLFG
jgi:8-oxo-dGTP pyrophosphatase MutT (NUDIX family)